MTIAEATVETFTQAFPNAGVKMVFINATTTNAGDYITVDDLTIVQGFYLLATSGATLATGSCSTTTNIITLTNGATGTKTWAGFCWGY